MSMSTLLRHWRRSGAWNPRTSGPSSLQACNRPSRRNPRPGKSFATYGVSAPARYRMALKCRRVNLARGWRRGGRRRFFRRDPSIHRQLLLGADAVPVAARRCGLARRLGEAEKHDLRDGAVAGAQKGAAHQRGLRLRRAHTNGDHARGARTQYDSHAHAQYDSHAHTDGDHARAACTQYDSHTIASVCAGALAQTCRLARAVLGRATLYHGQ